MEIINLSQKEYERLTKYDVGHCEHNSECEMFILDNLSQRNKKYSDGRFLLKRIYRNDSPDFEMKSFNVRLLNFNKELKNIKELVIPSHTVMVDRHAIGFTVEFIKDSVCLGELLKDSKIDNDKKIEYLAKVGKLLKKIKILNDKGIKFSLGDLHEYNFLIENDTEKLKAIDLDSVYLDTNYPSPSYYLNTSRSVLYVPNKYVPKYFNEKLTKDDISFSRILSEYDIDEIDYIIYPNHNTDLFCYIMMILNTVIANGKISKEPLTNYYEYLNYLKKLGFGKDIIKIFQNVYTGADNVNPVDYLDQIPINKLGEANLKVYQMKKNKKII